MLAYGFPGPPSSGAAWDRLKADLAVVLAGSAALCVWDPGTAGLGYGGAAVEAGSSARPDEGAALDGGDAQLCFTLHMGLGEVEDVWVFFHCFSSRYRRWSSRAD